jgi:hypothetical protein
VKDHVDPVDGPGPERPAVAAAAAEEVAVEVVDVGGGELVDPEVA